MTLGLDLSLAASRAASGAAPVVPLNLDFTGGLPAGVTATGGANGTYFDTSGLITAGSAPRTDQGNAWNPCYGQSGNYLLQSNTFSNATWLKGNTGVVAPSITQANNQSDPVGGSTASTVVIPAISVANNNSKLENLTTVVPNRANVASIWIKGASGGEVVSFWVQNGVTPFQNLGMVKIVATTSWVRYQFTFVPINVQTYLCLGVDNNTVTGAGPTSQAGGTLNIYNAQISLGDVATADVITTVAASLSVLPGLLVEPASTNLCLQSNAFSTSPWTLADFTAGKQVVVTPTFTTGPDGNATSAAKAVFIATTGTNQKSLVEQTVTGLSTTKPHTLSVWVKGNAGTEVLWLQAQDATTPFSGLANVRINPTTTWQRYSITFTPVSSSVFIEIGSNTSTGLGQTNAAGGTVFLYNCQLEALAYPTSDIVPTAGATVTRTAEAVSFTMPAGNDTLTVTYRDGTVQNLVATGGATYTLPTTLNRQKIKTITSASVSVAPITGITAGTVFAYNTNSPQRIGQGDSFAPFWASDDGTYSFADDTQHGFATTSANMGFNKFTDATINLTPAQTNAMAAWGTKGLNGTDGKSFKACGATCIDGVFYAFSTKQDTGALSSSPFKQPSVSAQLIKSVNRGVSWTPAPPSTAEPYASPMFSGTIGQAKFCTPYFITYDRDQQNSQVHNSDLYVYAVSSNNQWNNGDNMILGRCLKSAIGNQLASDWSFYTGGDGMQNGNWSATIGNAVAIITDTGQVGMCGAQWIPALKSYLMIQWWYPSINLGSPTNDSTTTAWAVWQSPTPWGTWTKVQTINPSPGSVGLYNPQILPKSVGIDNGITLLAASSGDYNITTDTGPYTLQLVPLTVTH